MSARQTREQQRASKAWDQVEALSDNIGKKYGPWARGLSSMIQANGLAQTLAFLKAKRKDEHLKLYGHLSAWLISQMNIPGNNPDLLHWLIQQNSAIYRRTTTEALAYAMWLRRFAEAKGWGEEEKTLQEAKYEGTP